MSSFHRARSGNEVLWCLLVVFSMSLGCDDGPFDEAQVLGGETVSAKTLNKGWRVYRRHCIACHGESGDGDGPSAAVSTPAPRDFRHGVYKFKSTPGDGLPTDDDLERVILRGLSGTNMTGVDLDADEVEAVSNYLKTFSSRWRESEATGAIEIASDPWIGQRTKAIARGKRVYHSEAQCWSCHPSYMEREKVELLIEADLELGKTVQPPDWREDFGVSVEQESVHGKLLPPDFYGGTLRAARTNSDLFRTVAAGIGGTEMPSWSQRLPSGDIWALVHYVRELERLGKSRRSGAR